MGANSGKYIKGVAAENRSLGDFTNAPVEQSDRETQYLGKQTRRFYGKMARYSSDYIKAESQGINPDNFYEYYPVNIRMANCTSATAAATHGQDDYKEVLFADDGITDIHTGAKIKAMGSVWLATNPGVISGVGAKTVAARCNASFNIYDYYGNIVSEPIVIERAAMLGDDNVSPVNFVLMDGYFNATAQANDITRQLNHNSRIILGSKAYEITGFTDFIQEYTGNDESALLLKFSLRLREPNAEMDDLERKIAGGKTRSFAAGVSGRRTIAVGAVSEMSGVFYRDGDEVSPTEEHPVDWEWAVSDGAIATVSPDGVVSGLAEGTAQITATLRQNPAVKAVADITVTAAAGDHVAFGEPMPESITQYESAALTAVFYRSGAPDPAAVIEWRFAGAPESAYGAAIGELGHSAVINCFEASDSPLEIEIVCEGKTAVAQVVLEGY